MEAEKIDTTEFETFLSDHTQQLTM